MTRNPVPAALLPVTMALQAGEIVVALDCVMLLGAQGPLQIEGLIHHRFDVVDAGFLAKVQPALLVVPLFSASYDALGAVEQLEALHYQGRIIVLAPDLPKPQLVERELQMLGPGTRLMLITP